VTRYWSILPRCSFSRRSKKKFELEIPLAPSSPKDTYKSSIELGATFPKTQQQMYESMYLALVLVYRRPKKTGLDSWLPGRGFNWSISSQNTKPNWRWLNSKAEGTHQFLLSFGLFITELTYMWLEYPSSSRRRKCLARGWSNDQSIKRS